MRNSNNKSNRRSQRSANNRQHSYQNGSQQEYQSYSRNAGQYRSSGNAANNQSFNQYSRSGGNYGSGYQPVHQYTPTAYTNNAADLGGANRASRANGTTGAGAQGFSDEARMNYIRQQQAANKKAKHKKIALIAVLVVLVLCLGAAGAAFAYAVSINNNMQENVDEDLLNALTVTDSASDPFYMLLLGVDKSEDREDSNVYGGSYRSDSMILARIDPKNKTATMVSIPRDTQVTISGYGTQKINAAYAYGGPSGAIKAVEDVCGVKISHYAEIDFDGFEAVVDAVGGVEVDVALEIDDDYTGHIDAGLQTLDGEQALILCRSRHAYDKYATDGDTIRAAYQRTVISAVAQKLISSDIITMTNGITAMSKYITTDLDVATIIGIATNMRGIDVQNNVYTAQLPTTSSYENNLWYEKINTTEWQKMMKRVEAGLSPTEEDVVDTATGVKTANSGTSSDSSSSTSSSSSSDSSSDLNLKGSTISIKNGCGVAGVAAEAENKIKSTGATISTGNADSTDYASTFVMYNDSSNASKAEALAAMLGKGTAKQNPGSYSFKSDFLIVIGKDW